MNKNYHKSYLRTAYLKCEAERGMFPVEKSLTFRDYEGDIINGFFYNGNITNENLLKVLVHREEKDLVHIILPQTPLGARDKDRVFQIVKRNQILYEEEMKSPN